MAAFTDSADTFSRLDFALLRNGYASLYWRREYFEQDVAWLSEHGYRIAMFDSTAWADVRGMHDSLAATLSFPDYYGANLDALNDCLGDVDVPEDGGLVLAFHRFDDFAARHRETAQAVLDIAASCGRSCLLFGRRLLLLAQSDDPNLSFAPVGAAPVLWNSREWLNKNREL